MTDRKSLYASFAEPHQQLAQENAVLTLRRIADSDAGGWLMEFTARNVVRYIERLELELATRLPNQEVMNRRAER